MSRPMIDIGELAQLANARTRELVAELLPNGRDTGHFWEVGSIEGERGQSLKVNLKSNVGWWTDFSAAKGTPGASGDMLGLVAAVKFGGQLAQAVAWMKSRLGLDGLDPERLATRRAEAHRIAARSADESARAAEAKRRKAVSLFLRGQPIAGTPAERYLLARGIDLRALGRAPGALRFAGDVWCQEAGGKLPAMLAMVTNVEGRHLATHRTWLTERGGLWRKAEVATPKKVLGAFGGGFIPLWKGDSRAPMGALPDGTDVFVTEGVEDGLTCAIARPSLRIVAAVSLGNIGAVALPPQAGSIVIVADRDAHGSKAREALERAIAQQQATGRPVKLVLPPEGAKDMNEALTAGTLVPEAARRAG